MHVPALLRKARNLSTCGLTASASELHGLEQTLLASTLKEFHHLLAGVPQAFDRLHAL